MARKSRSSPALMPERSNQGRSTFAVSNALNQIRLELPDVLFDKKARKADDQRKPDLPLPSAAPASVRRPVAPVTGDRAKEKQVARVIGAKRSPLLDDKKKEERHCKAKPSDTKRSGNGAGRSFVPWCK